MGITFVAAGTKADGAGGVTANLPAGIVTDDLLILGIAGKGEDVSADSANADWTLIGTVANDTAGGINDTRLTLYSHVYDSASPPDLSIPDAGNYTLTVITAWRNVDTASPINVSQSSFDDVNDTSLSISGVTSTSNDCMIVYFTTTGDNGTFSGWANSNLVSIAEAFDANTTTGSDGAIAAAYGILTTAGASGNTTATPSLTGKEANFAIALEPDTVEISGSAVFVGGGATLEASGNVGAAVITGSAEFVGGGAILSASGSIGTLNVIRRRIEGY